MLIDSNFYFIFTLFKSLPKYSFRRITVFFTQVVRLEPYISNIYEAKKVDIYFYEWKFNPKIILYGTTVHFWKIQQYFVPCSFIETWQSLHFSTLCQIVNID